MPKLSYDFHGINIDGQRFATINKNIQHVITNDPAVFGEVFSIQERDYYGRLLEKSSEMLEMVKDYSNLLLDQDKLIESQKADSLINYIEGEQNVNK